MSTPKASFDPKSMLMVSASDVRSSFLLGLLEVRLLEFSTRCRCSGEFLSFSQDVMMPSNIPGTGCPALCVQGYLMKARTI